MRYFIRPIYFSVLTFLNKMGDKIEYWSLKKPELNDSRVLSAMAFSYDDLFKEKSKKQNQKIKKETL